MELEIKKLQRFEHNPKSRIEKKAVVRLARSMKKVGQLAPILTINNKRIFDGEGRVEAAKLNGWKKIKVVNINLPKGVKFEEAYREANSTARKFSGKNRLELYKSGCKNFFSDSEWKNYETLESENLLDKLKGISPDNLCKTANNICSYLGTNTVANYKKVLKYLVNNGDIMFVKSSFKKIQKATLQRKIDRNEKLTVG